MVRPIVTWRKGVVIVVACVLAAFVFDRLRRQSAARESADLASDLLQSVVTGLVNYEILRGPVKDINTSSEAVDAILSWRVALAPYMSAKEVFPAYQEAWDSPTNRAAAPGPRYYTLERDVGSETAVVAIRGADSFFDDGDGIAMCNGADSNAIYLIESHGTGIDWMQPGDLTIAELERRAETHETARSALHLRTDVFHVVFADGTIWRLRSSVPTERIVDLAKLSRARQTSREALLGEYRIASYMPPCLPLDPPVVESIRQNRRARGAD